MPTGYTAKLMEKGQSFRDFAMTCARAFGACIELRDDPMDAPIPEKFEPSDYSVKALAESKEQLASLEAMTEPQRIAFGESKKSDELKSSADWLAKEEAEQNRLNTMAVDVTAWKPPTTDHRELKEFMLQQISVSRHDPGYIRNKIAELQMREAVDFYRQAVESAKWAVDYHEKDIVKQQQRADERTDWVSQLRHSLPKL